MEKEVNCINSRAILHYIMVKNNGDCSTLLKDLDPEIDRLEDPARFLCDANNWISSSVASKLYERARLVLDDEMAAYKIAKYAIENTDLGFRSLIVKVFGSYNRALKNVDRINAKWNRNKQVELVELKTNAAIIRLHWAPNMEVTKDICLYNQGAYTYIPLTWGGQPVTLRETRCFFEGASFCEYQLSWTTRDRFRGRISRFFKSKTFLMETITEIEKNKELIEQKYAEVNRLNLQLNQKIRQLMAVQETGKAILSVLELNTVLTIIMNILSSTCQINRALIMMVNDSEQCLEYLHGAGFEGGIPKDIQEYRVPLDRLSNILARVASTGRPEYIPEVGNSRLRKGNIILTQAQPSSVYVVPLITRSKVIGVIATDSVGDRGVPRETRETLEIFAPQIAIAIQNARLYDQLREQMVELKRSHALLSRAEKLSFLGNLSARLAHEIKNPMTAIETFIQLLPQKYNDEEFRNNFHRIALEETQRVNNLINELLDLVHTPEPLFELGNLHELIDKMVLLLSPQSKNKDIRVTRNFSKRVGLVWMDAEKMKQVILNILSNAAEFTPPGGNIIIETRQTFRPDKTPLVEIEISDSGPGIPSSMIDNIFDPYFTTKHKSSMHKGTGLGLFIAHKHMQEHGGTIEVKSKVNQGATFIMTMPNTAPVAAALKQPRFTVVR